MKAMRVWSLIIGLWLLGATADISAQTFKATVLGGFNFSQIEGDRLAGYRKFGFNAGARISVDFSDRWSMGTEFLFSQQGANRGVSDDISSSFDRIHLNFVEVPVVGYFSDWKIKAGAGFSFSRLINSEITSFTGEDISPWFPLKDSQWSIVFDGIYQFSEKWQFNVRWSRQLSSLIAAEDTRPDLTIPPDDPGQMNRPIDPNTPDPLPFHSYMVTMRLGYTF